MTQKPKPLVERIQHIWRGEYYGWSWMFFKNDIKEACEFYLKYKDRPKLLVAEHPEFEKEVGRFIGMLDNAESGFDIRDAEKKYNEWLFRLTFKDVLEAKT